MSRRKRAPAQPRKSPAHPSFGTVGALGQFGLEQAPPAKGQPNQLLEMNQALGNRAMGTLLSGMVKDSGDRTLGPGVEGPEPLPRIDVGKPAAKPKELSLEERFNRFVDPFLRQLLSRIKDEKRRDSAVENIRENFKRLGQGWLDQGLNDSELDPMEQEEIKRGYEERAYEEWWIPP